MSDHAPTLRTEQHAIDPILSRSFDSTSCVQVISEYTFGEAEQLLLYEARQRFDFEQKTSGALHSKSALFLALTGVFAAFITSLIGRLLDRLPGSFFDIAALCLLLLSLCLLTIATILLARSALSRSYQIIATPAHWAQHLINLKQNSSSEAETLSRLQQDILEAWMEATEACNAVNETKASMLGHVSKLIYIAVPAAFLAVVFLVLQAMAR